MNATHHTARAEPRLAGHVSVITGGNGGIGLALARGLAKAGARIAILARRENANTTAAAELESLGAEVFTRCCDVSDESDVTDGMRAVLDRFGRIDSAFANAGIVRRSDFLSLTLDDWRSLLAVDLDGVFLTFREAARVMIENGRGGSLVAVSSTSAFFGAPRMPHYSAAKAGVLALMRSAAIELAPHRVRVNALVPGWTDTDMLSESKAHKRFFDATIDRTPVRRWGVANDFAEPAVFLADPSLMFHTGDTLVVDGGYSVY